MLPSTRPIALMAKVNLKSAFRMVPVHREDWELLGMHWRNHFYIDTCLPFGLRSAPFLFNEVASALQWILQNNYAIRDMLHYLDDYLMAGPPEDPACARYLRTFLEVAAQLGVQVAMEKVDGPSPILSFLGLLLDSLHQEIRLTPPSWRSCYANSTAGPPGKSPQRDNSSPSLGSCLSRHARSRLADSSFASSSR